MTQLALYDGSDRRVASTPRRQTPNRRAENGRREDEKRLCAACQAREARYGFRNREDDPTVDRPKTLCFDCFRIELDRRRLAAEQLARGWNATQEDLPLAGKLEEVNLRRRRAQIAARRALGLR